MYVVVLCFAIYGNLCCRPVAAAKHAQFLLARGRHYSNEAEAMKVRHSIHSGMTSVLTLDTFRCLFFSAHKHSWPRKTKMTNLIVVLSRVVAGRVMSIWDITRSLMAAPVSLALLHLRTRWTPNAALLCIFGLFSFLKTYLYVLSLLDFSSFFLTVLVTSCTCKN
jgi:hypothetical protein